jgi:hypothetical protein
MLYKTTSLATDFNSPDWRKKAISALLFFIPQANPDDAKHYPKIKEWALEIDDEGCVVREIGLDISGIPIVRAPNGRNLGFWTDEDKKFQEDEIRVMSRQRFEELWKRL